MASPRPAPRRITKRVPWRRPMYVAPPGGRVHFGEGRLTLCGLTAEKTWRSSQFFDPGQVPCARCWLILTRPQETSATQNGSGSPHLVAIPSTIGPKFTSLGTPLVMFVTCQLVAWQIQYSGAGTVDECLLLILK